MVWEEIFQIVVDINFFFLEVDPELGVGSYWSWRTGLVLDMENHNFVVLTILSVLLLSSCFYDFAARGHHSPFVLRLRNRLASSMSLRF